MTPDSQMKELIYKFYCLIYESDFSLAKKRALLTAVMAYEQWSWRVVGITEDAIRVIARNGFRKPKHALARDHTQPRAITYTKVFCSGLMPFEEWWNWIWTHDKTILMTNKEHNSKNVSKVYPVDPGVGLFRSTGLVGWRHTIAIEGEFVRQLTNQYSIKIV